MLKTEKRGVPTADFKEQTPEMLLKEEKTDHLYEKALLSTEDTAITEYARNTTTWDLRNKQIKEKRLRKEK